ncbi:MAG: peptidylprolyl isomerase [Bacteroidetes bacterium]|nr:peptidylprolyl isomerase [Bacteroidota bacterium]
MKAFFFGWILAGTAGSVLAQSSDRDLQTVIMLQDSRAGAVSFYPYLKSGKPEVAERALLALANLQDPAAISRIVPLADHPEPAVRKAAAFAFAQTGDSSVADLLTDLVLTEEIPDVRSEWARAAGRCLPRSESEALLDTLEATGDAGSAAEILVRLSVRAVVSDSILMSALRLCSHPEPTSSWKALYALNRFKKPDTSWWPLISARHTILSASPSAQVRMAWAAVTGGSGDARILPALQVWFASEPDPMVRSTLIRSASRLPEDSAQTRSQILISAMTDPVPMVQAAAQTALTGLPQESLPADRISAALKSRLSQVKTPLAKPDIDWMVLSARLNLPWHQPLVSSLATHSNPLLKAQYAVLLAAPGSKESLPALRQLLEAPETPVKTLAATALLEILKKAGLPPDSAGHEVKSLIFSRDMALISIGSEALGDPAFQYAGYAADLIKALDGLDPVTDTEAIQAVLNTLGPVKAEKVDSVFGAFSVSSEKVLSVLAINWIRKRSGAGFTVESLDAEPVTPGIPVAPGSSDLKKKQWIEFQTSKGTILVELLVQDAPVTCSKLAGLVQKGYYNGLYFHRLVPNFVIQGGDPRGDGWGGPGFAMRSEFAPVRYDHEGVVGMASAGKDTEGSQFFIVHSATPHLDGRYTIWGRVVSGLPVVPMLDIGDQILRAVVLDSLPVQQEKAKKGKSVKQ